MFTILIRKFINNILFILTKRNISKAKKNPVLCQDKIFKKILKESQKSTFGKDHNLTKNDTLQSYQKKVKVNIYEDYKPYIDKIMSAEKNVLWKGMPECITISSGTTSGHKYVPIYKKLLKAHYSSAFYAVLNFCLETKQYEILEDELLIIGMTKLIKY